MATSQHAMPMILLNMGAEMLYILKQRLVAQNVEMSKRRTVLSDVLSHMFSEEFLEELLRPQLLIPDDQVLEIFRKLAHSSIMKLNETSMSKLYDLMTMGFKRQVLSCRHLDDLLAITDRHIKTIALFVKNDSSLFSSIEKCAARVQKKFSAFTEGEYHELKETLAMFFLHRHVRVSLFLKSGAQNNDGTFQIRIGGPIHESVELPGIVRYFSATGKKRIESCAIVSADIVSDKDDRVPKWREEMGSNIYEDEEPTVVEAKSNTEGSDTTLERTTSSESKRSSDDSGTAASATLKLLTSIIDRRAPEDSERNLKIDFSAGVSFGVRGDARSNFNTTSEDSSSSKTSRTSAAESSGRYRAKMRAFEDSWAEEESGKSSKRSASSRGKYDDDDDDDDDLLSLMDDASLSK